AGGGRGASHEATGGRGVRLSRRRARIRPRCRPFALPRGRGTPGAPAQPAAVRRGIGLSMGRHHAPPPARYELHPQLAADTHPLATLELCELRLMDDANYPWLVLVPRVPEARELVDLEAAQRRLLTDEIDLASRLLRDLFRPFKLNVAALGNLVPQLH